jgi:hypothetical protein
MIGTRYGREGQTGSGSSPGFYVEQKGEHVSLDDGNIFM